MFVQEAAFATDVLPDLYAFHRSTRHSASPSDTQAHQFATPFLGEAEGFHAPLDAPPTRPLRPVIPNNACPLRLTAAAGTELAGASSSGTGTADGSSPPASSSPTTALYTPKGVFTHAALLRQAFAHCAKFPTAASRRSLGRVSVPVWLIILSDQLPIVALVGRYPTS